MRLTTASVVKISVALAAALLGLTDAALAECTFDEAQNACFDEVGERCTIAAFIGPCGHIIGNRLDKMFMPLPDDAVPLKNTRDGILKFEAFKDDVLMNYSKINLRGAKFEGMFPFANFNESDLRGADFSGAELSGSTFHGTKLYGANFAGANLISVTFGFPSQGVYADLSYANFNKATLTYASFHGVSVNRATFVEASAEHAVFDFAGVRNADFTKAELQDSNWRSAVIGGSNFTDANMRFADLRDTTFINSNSEYAKFTRTHLNYALSCASDTPEGLRGLERFHTAGLINSDAARAQQNYQMRGWIYFQKDVCDKFPARSERLAAYSETPKSIDLLTADDKLKGITFAEYVEKEPFKSGGWFPLCPLLCNKRSTNYLAYTYKQQAAVVNVNGRLHSWCGLWGIRVGSTIEVVRSRLAYRDPGGAGPGHFDWAEPVGIFATTVLPETIWDLYVAEPHQTWSNNYQSNLLTFGLHLVPFGGTADRLTTSLRTNTDILTTDFVVGGLFDIGSAFTALGKLGYVSVASKARISAFVFNGTAIGWRVKGMIEDAAKGQLNTEKFWGGSGEIVLGSIMMGINLRDMLKAPRLPPVPAPKVVRSKLARQDFTISNPAFRTNWDPDDFPTSKMVSNPKEGFPKIMAGMANEAEIMAAQLKGGKDIRDRLGAMRRKAAMEAEEEGATEFGTYRNESAIHTIYNPQTHADHAFRKDLGKEILDDLKINGTVDYTPVFPDGMRAKVVKYTTLDGEVIETTTVSNIMLRKPPYGIYIESHFSDAEAIKKVLLDSDKRLAKIKLMPVASKDDALKEFGRALHGYMQACPFRRGTDSTMRAYFQGHFRALFGKKVILPDATDVRAFYMDSETFANWLLPALKKAF